MGRRHIYKVQGTVRGGPFSSQSSFVAQGLGKPFSSSERPGGTGGRHIYEVRGTVRGGPSFGGYALFKEHVLRNSPGS